MTDFARIVLNTRPRNTSGEFEAALAKHDIETISFPMIELAAPSDWGEVDKAIEAIELYTAIIYTSANAVQFFLRRVQEVGRDITTLPDAIAIGDKTKEALNAFGLEGRVYDGVETGFDLANAIEDVSNQYFLQPASNIAKKELAERIQERGGKVNTVLAYETKLPSNSDLRAIDDRLIMGEIDCIAFWSPSAVNNFCKLIPEFKQATVLIAAIGQTTAAAVGANGLRIDVIADEPTGEVFAQSIVDRLISDERIQFNEGEQVDLT
ncbi:MAG: hypothetical protein CL946_01780 [Ectothiorhodospiraceae bacterium]|nr:hypothetical protein [Ectothiorhodospiraceae bacterium]